jgi:hypothetical protein
MPHRRETFRRPRKGGRNPTLWGLPSWLRALALTLPEHRLVRILSEVALSAVPLHKPFFFTALRRGCPVLARFFARAGGTNLYDGCLLRYKSATFLTLEPNDVEGSDARPSQRARRTGHPLCDSFGNSKPGPPARNSKSWGLPSLLCFKASARALALGFSFDFAGASIGSHTLRK